MAEFADSLFEQYPIPAPPPPRASDMVGAFFGAAPDRIGAHAAGLKAGSEYRLRSAQGDKTLEEAGVEREKRLQASQANALRQKVVSNPNYQPTVSEMLLVANGANDFASSRLGFQEFDNRSILGDQSAAPAAQFAAGQGVQGKMLPQLYDVGGETVNMAQDPTATFQTPAQQMKVGADEALIGQRNRSPVAGTIMFEDLTPEEVAAAGFAPNTVVQRDSRGRLFTPQKPSTATTGNLSSAQRVAVSGNNALLAQIDNAIALVEANPNSFGLKYSMGDVVNQRLDPGGVTARAAVANIGSAVIHDRSGAAVSAKEFPRLTPFVGSVTDRSDSLADKLRQMRATVEDENNALQASWQAGAPPASLAAAPAGPAASAPAAAEPMRRLSKSGKPIVSMDGGQTWEYE